MSTKVLQQRKRLSAVFASFAILIFGTASLMQNMAIDYYSVLNTIQKVIPASFVIGALGWVTGMILDQPKRKKRLGNNSALINDLLKSSQKLPTGVNTEVKTDKLEN